MDTKKIFGIDGELLPTMCFDVLEQEESIEDGQLSAEESLKLVEKLSHRASQTGAIADISVAIVNLETAINEASNDSTKLRQTLSELDKKAKSGDIAAKYKMGVLYLEGRSPIEKDEVKGLDFLLSAARLGYAPAQAKVGRYYMYVTKQRSKALPYLYAAAVQGNEDANLLLGISYKEGVPGALEHDPIEALRYLKRATIETLSNSYKTWERGVAAHILAEMYRDGEGVSNAPEEAIKWYRIALKNGADVKTDLANLLKSQNDPSAKQEATNLLADAAKEGNKNAQALLADEKWDKELSAITIGTKRICFWLVQGKTVDSEIKSQQHIRSTPSIGNSGPSVYSVTDSWKVLHFEKRDGGHIKINLPDEAKKVSFTVGERIAVLYAGLAGDTGDATGYPYMIYCLDQKKIIRVETLAKLLEECGISKASASNKRNNWIGLVASSLFSLIWLIGLLGVAWFGYQLYRSPKSGEGNPSALVSGHLDKIESWVYASLVR